MRRSQYIVVLIIAAVSRIWTVAAAPVDKCKAPDIARVVADLQPSWNGPLICPDVGMCFHDIGDMARGVSVVVCLTPAEHEAALVRGRP